MPLKKITICAFTEKKDEVEFVDQWIEKWKPKFRHFKRHGCGCCVIFYDVLAPSSAVQEVPEHLLAWSDWSKPEVFNKKK